MEENILLHEERKAFGKSSVIMSRITERDNFGIEMLKKRIYLIEMRQFIFLSEMLTDTVISDLF